MAKTRKVAARRFYKDALDAAEQAQLPAAMDADGIDEEIAVLRIRLRRAIEEHPEDLPLMYQGIDLLAKVVATRFKLTGAAKKQISDEMQASLAQLDALWPLDVPHE